MSPVGNRPCVTFIFLWISAANSAENVCSEEFCAARVEAQRKEITEKGLGSDESSLLQAQFQRTLASNDGERNVQAENGELQDRDEDETQPWSNYLTAFKAKDAVQITSQYSSSSSIFVYNHADGSIAEFTGLLGIANYFQELFTNISDASDLDIPVVDVKEGVDAKPGSVFLVWYCPTSGYTEAAETFMLDQNGKVAEQHVIVNYEDPNGRTNLRPQNLRPNLYQFSTAVQISGNDMSFDGCASRPMYQSNVQPDTTSVPGWTCGSVDGGAYNSDAAPRPVCFGTTPPGWAYAGTGISGAGFLGLQMDGCYVEQKFTGVPANAALTIAFKAARRKKYPAPLLEVFVDNARVYSELVSNDVLGLITMVTGTSDSSGFMTLRFTSGSAFTGKDMMLFLDDISITAQPQASSYTQLSYQYSYKCFDTGAKLTQADLTPQQAKDYCDTLGETCGGFLIVTTVRKVPCYYGETCGGITSAYYCKPGTIRQVPKYAEIVAYVKK